eukprot:CAMPEP_0170074406 /NCGR_PEP_ID=MMETSP0019_2-20121128/11702_1 /TAXON_ID=98059 /ORGANISM="Dinobryon sp., Strain UTEXLB2267" /LENGTH=475 /DNA_ID=CAMNT_0010284661 /DNA_START=1 /DNA_END=1428 /DNA_ORIENTATION=+
MNSPYYNTFPPLNEEEEYPQTFVTGGIMSSGSIPALGRTNPFYMPYMAFPDHGLAGFGNNSTEMRMNSQCGSSNLGTRGCTMGVGHQQPIGGNCFSSQSMGFGATAPATRMRGFALPTPPAAGLWNGHQQHQYQYPGFGTTPNVGFGFGQQQLQYDQPQQQQPHGVPLGWYEQTQQQQATGTGNPPFAPVQIPENVTNGTQRTMINVNIQTITAMQEYNNKCVEELRLEDYKRGNNRGSTALRMRGFSGVSSPPSLGMSIPTTSPPETSSFGGFRSSARPFLPSQTVSARPFIPLQTASSEDFLDFIQSEVSDIVEAAPTMPPYINPHWYSRELAPSCFYGPTSETGMSPSDIFSRFRHRNADLSRRIEQIHSERIKLRSESRSNVKESTAISVQPSDNNSSSNVKAADAVKTEPESNLCCVCLENPKCVVLLPCKHLCICETCGEADVEEWITFKVKKCPICRERIQQRYKVFM